MLLFLVLHWWASRLIRPMEVYFYYIIATVSLLPVLSIALRSFYVKSSKWLMFFLGAVCAQAIGMLAFLIVPFFLSWLSNERFAALIKLGIGNIFGVSAAWTFASGIWVAGGVGFLIIGYRWNKTISNEK